MVDRINKLREEAEAAVAAAVDEGALEELRVRYLGRKAELTTILRGIAELPAAERGPVGKSGNEARAGLEALIDGRKSTLQGAELDERLAGDVIDVTLPGTTPVGVGQLHLLTRTRREIEDVFICLGYRVLEGPEIEHDYYNFTALNHPPGHSARMLQDTFYIDPATLPPPDSLPLPDAPGMDSGGASAAGAAATLPSEYGPRDVMLRTHTSPMQIRAMESQEPPIFIVVPGVIRSVTAMRCWPGQ